MSRIEKRTIIEHMQKLLIVMDKVNSIDIGNVHSLLGYKKNEKRPNGELQI